MNDLKTLKDFRPYWFPNQVKCERTKMFMQDELRQEAIKWILDARNQKDNNPEAQNKLWYLNGWIDGFKQFFNIEEIELKPEHIDMERRQDEDINCDEQIEQMEADRDHDTIKDEIAEDGLAQHELDLERGK